MAAIPHRQLLFGWRPGRTMPAFAMSSFYALLRSLTAACGSPAVAESALVTYQSTPHNAATPLVTAEMNFGPDRHYRPAARLPNGSAAPAGARSDARRRSVTSSRAMGPTPVTYSGQDNPCLTRGSRTWCPGATGTAIPRSKISMRRAWPDCGVCWYKSSMTWPSGSAM